MGLSAWVPMVVLLAAPCGVACAQQTRSSPELELIAHVETLPQGTDLWAHKNVVYLGTGLHATMGGISRVDISDPARPALLERLPGRPGTSYFGLQVISAETPAFKGDLLAAVLRE